MLAWSELSDYITITVPAEINAAMAGVGTAAMAGFRATVDTVASMFGTSFDEIANFATAAFDQCVQVAKAFGDAAIKVAGVAALAVAASMGPAGLAFAAATQALAKLGPVGDEIVGGFQEKVAAIGKAHIDATAQAADASKTAMQAVADKHASIAQAAMDAFKAARDEALKGLDTESAETKELKAQLDLQLQLLQAERDRQRAKAAAAGAGGGPAIFVPPGLGPAGGKPPLMAGAGDQPPGQRYQQADPFKIQFIRPEDLYQKATEWANQKDDIQKQIADNTGKANEKLDMLINGNGIMIQKLGQDKPARFGGP